MNGARQSAIHLRPCVHSASSRPLMILWFRVFVLDAAQRCSLGYAEIRSVILEPSANTGTNKRLFTKIITMARELGIQVISEGVETEAQATMLQSLGCTLAQGYLYAKLAPPAALEQILDEGGDMA